MKRKIHLSRLASLGLVFSSLISMPFAVLSETGVSEDAIRLAGVMDLKGRSKDIGQAMKKGLEAALKGQLVRDRAMEISILNDSYTPSKTVVAVNDLLGADPFLFVGNVGTPTAKAALPILADEKIPVVGFLSGSGFLRPGSGSVLNYRASYVQETAAVIESALEAGYRPDEICAYVQSDAYGSAGLEGIKRALRGKPDSSSIISAIEQVIQAPEDAKSRNGLGPVGVYQRNTFRAREGYQSLKKWEKATSTQCRLIVTTGVYGAIAKFIGYANYKGEDWSYSAVSFTGANSFFSELSSSGVNGRVVMTQVVPLLGSRAPVVSEARTVLGDDFGYVSLEGFIVGKMLLRIFDQIDGELTRVNFMNAALGNRFDLGGVDIDFRDDNQGSDLVELTYFTDDGWQAMPAELWRTWRRAQGN